jgi:diadenosine tetraphosphate (Ap4A) HIT family hydrolase
MTYYEPLKMSYETLGNSLPHLHTHLVPRFAVDPAPGQPFPLLAQNATEPRMQDAKRVMAEAMALRALIVGPDA